MLPSSSAGRTGSRRWWDSDFIFPSVGTNIRCDSSRRYSAGSTDARNATASTNVEDCARRNSSDHRQLFGDCLDGYDFGQKAKLRSPTESGTLRYGKL